MTPSAAPVPPAQFRSLMSRWATGVAIVTATGPAGDAGLTVNSLASIALDPPTLLVSLSRDADTLPVLEGSRRFGASFLAADQREVSERFARTIPAAEKFRGLTIHRGPGGSPLIEGGLGALECRLERAIELFDHVVLVGIVEHTEPGRDAPPLVFYRSGYASEDGEDRLRLPPPKR